MLSRVGLGGTNGSSSFGRVREVSAKHSSVMWGTLPSRRRGRQWALQGKDRGCGEVRNERRSSSVVCFIFNSTLDEG